MDYNDIYLKDEFTLYKNNMCVFNYVDNFKSTRPDAVFITMNSGTKLPRGQGRGYSYKNPDLSIKWSLNVAEMGEVIGFLLRPLDELKLLHDGKKSNNTQDGVKNLYLKFNKPTDDRAASIQLTLTQKQGKERLSINLTKGDATILRLFLEEAVRRCLYQRDKMPRLLHSMKKQNH